MNMDFAMAFFDMHVKKWSVLRILFPIFFAYFADDRSQCKVAERDRATICTVILKSADNLQYPLCSSHSSIATHTWAQPTDSHCIPASRVESTTTAFDTRNESIFLSVVYGSLCTNTHFQRSNKFRYYTLNRKDRTTGRLVSECDVPYKLLSAPEQIDIHNSFVRLQICTYCLRVCAMCAREALYLLDTTNCPHFEPFPSTTELGIRSHTTDLGKKK